MVAALSIGSAEASLLTFFGEDLNSSATVPLGAFPNSDAAEANFLSNLTGVGTEDFEGFTTGNGAPLTLTFPGAGTATLSGAGSIASVTAGSTNGAGRYGTSPTNYWSVNANGGFTIDLSDPTAAFGFFGIDIGDFGEQLRITLNDTAGTVIDPAHTLGSVGSTDGSVFFFGLIGTTPADTFTQIAFSTASGDGDVFAFDDMTIGSPTQVVPIPEPASIAILGMGLVGLGVMRRRKAS